MLTDQQIDSVTLAQWGAMPGSLALAHRAYARAVEAAATAEARALVVDALAALANPSLTWQQSRAEAERILGTWLGEAQKGDGHA